MFFQWRQARYGQEKFHSAMLGHRGEASRSFQETKAFGAELQRLATGSRHRVRSPRRARRRLGLLVGILGDRVPPSQRLNWLAQARAWNAALYALGHPVDTVRAVGPFDGYDVVVVPNLYIADAAQAAALAEFVARGGQLVVGPFSGVVDATETVHDGGAPGPLRELLGVEVDEHWPIADGRAERVELGGVEFGNPVWSEWLELHEGTEVLAQYTSGELAGRAAATRRPRRAGTAPRGISSAVLEPDGVVALFREVLAAAGLPARERTDSDLEAVTRTDATTDYTFVLNHGRGELTVDVPDGAEDLLTGIRSTGWLTLGRFGAAVLATPHAEAPPFITLSDTTD